MRALRWLLFAPLLLISLISGRSAPGAPEVEAPPPPFPSVENEPAILLLDAERHAEVRWVLESRHRVYALRRWRRPDPARLADLVSRIDEDQLIIVGPSSEHLRTARLAPEAPIVVGRIPLIRSDGEIAAAVDRLAERARAPMIDERELYRLVRNPARRV